MDRELDLFHTAGDPSESVWSVADVTSRARQLVEAGFRVVWVKGEITGLKRYRSGHWYFTVRDASAQARCVMWRDDNRRLPKAPDEGTQVFLECRPTVWEERGEFRLTVRRMISTEGDGRWERQFRQARENLARDGLLEPDRKRAIPPFPRRIAVVTSPDGAALHDVMRVVGRRWPIARLLLIPSRVQGDGAEAELCRALGTIDSLEGIDLAILCRGGGSREDLWAFNSERVARAVAAVQVPVVAGVGHDTDVTLVDLVADLRAPTPSAAAEAAVPDRVEVARLIDQLAERLDRALVGRTGFGRERLERTRDRLMAAMDRQLERRRRAVGELAARLDALSPLAVLQRGFALPRGPDGHVLRARMDFRPGMPFTLTVRDGDVPAQVRGDE